MSPVLALDLGNGGDIAGAKGRSLPGEDDEEQGNNKEHAAAVHTDGRHVGRTTTTSGGCARERKMEERHR